MSWARVVVAKSKQTGVALASLAVSALGVWIAYKNMKARTAQAVPPLPFKGERVMQVAAR